MRLSDALNEAAKPQRTDADREADRLAKRRSRGRDAEWEGMVEEIRQRAAERTAPPDPSDPSGLRRHPRVKTTLKPARDTIEWFKLVDRKHGRRPEIEGLRAHVGAVLDAYTHGDLDCLRGELARLAAHAEEWSDHLAGLGPMPEEAEPVEAHDVR